MGPVLRRSPTPPDPSQPTTTAVAPARRAHRRLRGGVAGNERLTSSLGAVLFVLLAVEGVTIVELPRRLTLHEIIGVMLVPPVLVKLGSTGHRFIRYYRGDAAYREKGPPHIVLRLLGPFVVVLTVVVIATGIALLPAPRSWRADLLHAHTVSFVLWFGAMTLHVLGHLAETARLAPADWLRRSRRQVAGAGLRQWLVVSALALGLIAGVLFVQHAGHYFRG